jgi:eukaryotic-like serine/threonine-protein kinase
MGSYSLEKKLGEGAMGEVWLARHTFLTSPAAVKIIRTDHLLSGNSKETKEILMARFDREARATSSLNSPHTVRLYDFGQSANGNFFYAMEYLYGINIEQFIELFGPQPQERVIHMLRQICDSLAEAHILGLIHRDIKPANVMVCRQGTQYDFIKVLDFGLVIETGDIQNNGDGENSNRLTAHDVISGTPAYMSPEQAMNLPDIDHRIDIYALGCVAYYMITGKDIFEASTSLAVLIHHIQTAPTPPSKRIPGLVIDPDLEALIMQCLEKDPNARPQSIIEFMERLNLINVKSWDVFDAINWYNNVIQASAHTDDQELAVITMMINELLKIKESLKN